MGANKRAGQAKQNGEAVAQTEAPLPTTPPESPTGGEEKVRRQCLHKQLRKTKFCTYFLKGTCQYGADCAFAHSSTELQNTPDLCKTRMCKAWSEGKCNDPACRFAHCEDELRSTDMFFKKTLCMWNEKGKCRNGAQCRFAHGLVELRDHVQTQQAEVPTQGNFRKLETSSWPLRSATEPMKVRPTVAPITIDAQACGLTAAQMPILPPMSLVNGLLPPLSPVDGQQLPEAVLAPMIADALEATRGQLHEMQAMTAGAHDVSTSVDLQQLCQNISTLSMQCSQIQQSLQSQYEAKQNDNLMAKMYSAMLLGKDVPYVPTFPDFAAYTGGTTCTGLTSDIDTLGDSSGLGANAGLLGPQELEWMSMQCDAAMGA